LRNDLWQPQIRTYFAIFLQNLNFLNITLLPYFDYFMYREAHSSVPF